ncbi:MAG TPA: alpha-amylase family glycosyl hydrolase, partial [Ignavibacteriales bacterium]|nr:alpha-amylase family glycosyl hydrolase [Ignavibacteriales bacterium]
MNIPLKIYEINARIWIKKFSNGQSGFTIADVPGSYWDYLKGLGFNAVWLMGIWKTNPDTIGKYCFTEPLKNNYSKALKNWKKEDVVGSPYSIDVYEVSSIFGSEKHICALREILNSKGMKLFLDFVPNHFNAESRYVYEMPEMFLQADKEIHDADIYTFYKPDKYADIYYAHGRDPFFPAWQDTVQVNFYSPAARKALTDVLNRIAELCDGVQLYSRNVFIAQVVEQLFIVCIIKAKLLQIPLQVPIGFRDKHKFRVL